MGVWHSNDWGVVVWLGGRCGEQCDDAVRSVPDEGGCSIVRPDTRTDDNSTVKISSYDRLTNCAQNRTCITFIMI